MLAGIPHTADMEVTAKTMATDIAPQYFSRLFPSKYSLTELPAFPNAGGPVLLHVCCRVMAPVLKKEKQLLFTLDKKKTTNKPIKDNSKLGTLTSRNNKTEVIANKRSCFISFF